MTNQQIAATFATILETMDGWHHGNNCALGTCEPCSWVKFLGQFGEQPMSLDEIIARANRRKR
jgi:hypothetical protein